MTVAAASNVTGAGGGTILVDTLKSGRTELRPSVGGGGDMQELEAWRYGIAQASTQL